MEKTVVVMAAGMGSRFGGLKQIEPVGPNNEIIADYSVYDAIRAGFTKVVFVIRKEHLDFFQNNITKNFEDKIKVEFAFQELSNVPEGTIIPDGRTKMLGTGHAFLCAKDKVNSDFILINGDDFYGKDAFMKVSEFFDNNHNNAEFISVNYPIITTMSKNGSVKRGICIVENDILKETVECIVDKENNKIIAKSLEDDRMFELESNHPVSVNCFGLRTSMFDLALEKFKRFNASGIDLENEFFLPKILREGINEGKIKGISKLCDSRWMGITYKEDLDEFKNNIKMLIESGEYPSKLW